MIIWPHHDVTFQLIVMFKPYLISDLGVEDEP